MATTAKSQVTITIDDVPQFYTPLWDDIYITGNFNGWEPADENYKMQRLWDGTFTIDLNSTSGTLIEYKFTRGDWTSVETQVNGSFLPNRTFTYTPGQDINVQVGAWEDLWGTHTATANTHILTMSFEMPQFNRTRRIWIYLPQDYHNTTDHYPVLYMHDGQNVFDVAFSFAGEWGVDEAMISMENAGEQPAIIVGIDNGEAERTNEYTPWTHPTYGGGDGDAYIDFIVQTLKPAIDSAFRTLPDRENTAIMGSSLGGLISFYGAIREQSVFSKAGIFSSSFWFSESAYTFPQTVGKQADMRMYFLAGELESTTMVSDMEAMYDTLLSIGFGSGEMKTVSKPDGTHSEWFWEREFPDAYRWLFAMDTTTAIGAGYQTSEPFMYYTDGLIYFNEIFDNDSARLILYDLLGRPLFHIGISDVGRTKLPPLPDGIYIALVENETSRFVQKIVIGK